MKLNWKNIKKVNLQVLYFSDSVLKRCYFYNEGNHKPVRRGRGVQAYEGLGANLNGLIIETIPTENAYKSTKCIYLL